MSTDIFPLNWEFVPLFSCGEVLLPFGVSTSLTSLEDPPEPCAVANGPGGELEKGKGGGGLEMWRDPKEIGGGEVWWLP